MLCATLISEHCHLPNPQYDEVKSARARNKIIKGGKQQWG